MRITIRSKNLRLRAAFSSYIEDKLLAHVRRVLGGKTHADLPILDLEFGRSTRHHQKGEVFYGNANLTLGKHVIRTEATAENVHSACDALREELIREIRGFKGKSAAVELRRARRLKKDVRLAKGARMYRKSRIRDEGM